jgi:hypothetical protein
MRLWAAIKAAHILIDIYRAHIVTEWINKVADVSRLRMVGRYPPAFRLAIGAIPLADSRSPTREANSILPSPVSMVSYACE